MITNTHVYLSNWNCYYSKTQVSLNSLALPLILLFFFFLDRSKKKKTMNSDSPPFFLYIILLSISLYIHAQSRKILWGFTPWRTARARKILHENAFVLTVSIKCYSLAMLYECREYFIRRIRAVRFSKTDG